MYDISYSMSIFFNIMRKLFAPEAIRRLDHLETVGYISRPGSLERFCMRRQRAEPQIVCIEAWMRARGLLTVIGFMKSREAFL